MTNALSKIGDHPVTVSPHRSMNTSKAFVRDESLAELDDAELIKELKSQGVTSVKRFTGTRNGQQGKPQMRSVECQTETPSFHIPGEAFSSSEDFVWTSCHLTDHLPVKLPDHLTPIFSDG
nr:hypothetical protein BaRGS_027005 [Batillaria attramentaria]